jgi:hypothetical protein
MRGESREERAENREQRAESGEPRDEPVLELVEQTGLACVCKRVCLSWSPNTTSTTIVTRESEEQRAESREFAPFMRSPTTTMVLAATVAAPHPAEEDLTRSSCEVLVVLVVVGGVGTSVYCGCSICSQGET